MINLPKRKKEMETTSEEIEKRKFRNNISFAKYQNVNILYRFRYAIQDGKKIARNKIKENIGCCKTTKSFAQTSGLCRDSVASENNCSSALWNQNNPSPPGLSIFGVPVISSASYMFSLEKQMERIYHLPMSDCTRNEKNEQQNELDIQKLLLPELMEFKDVFRFSTTSITRKVRLQTKSPSG
ncbi:hypothetical protein BCR32DRAFT_287717 [Anaeromyces robustus]|uniref:Uncharacterized protein n=1 Tax=Anaeromyces robustus TaxID=1754192 RepID=A0A1Y1VQA6_9FUNG|nr:hypothetical protein BCR32DRAFT_287717 [Anaeromyces robustus]|eukprot:ORX63498.1 hypothetical protein BCR32DRAFT_287717 [Anaeromyces robustus]